MDIKNNTKKYSERDIYIAFKKMMKQNGIFGIKPSNYWIDAVWKRDFKSKL